MAGARELSDLCAPRRVRGFDGVRSEVEVVLPDWLRSVEDFCGLFTLHFVKILHTFFECFLLYVNYVLYIGINFSQEKVLFFLVKKNI